MAPPDARLEIWFPSEDEVSIVVEADGVGFEREVAEATVFAAFAAGMILALGKRPETRYLCGLLADMPHDGVELFHMGELHIVPPSSAKGQKGFEGALKISPGLARMGIKPKGFGLFSRGVGFYAPMAALALFLDLHQRQSPDGRFVLVETARRIGTLGAARHITITSQAQVADDAVHGALAEVRGDAGDGRGRGVRG